MRRLALILSVVSIAACRPAINVPPGSATPVVVLDAYLQTLVVRDCIKGRKMATMTLKRGNGDLCGDTEVKAYRINPQPARPSPSEVVFATSLTTTGTADGSVSPGETTWFYDLVRQPDGSWKIAGGGSGP